eukprot:5334822-Amphidinium_carterae.1
MVRPGQRSCKSTDKPTHWSKGQFSCIAAASRECCGRGCRKAVTVVQNIKVAAPKTDWQIQAEREFMPAAAQAEINWMQVLDAQSPGATRYLPAITVRSKLARMPRWHHEDKLCGFMCFWPGSEKIKIGAHNRL